MKQTKRWMQILILICATALTSCEIDNLSNDSDEYVSKLANTRWQLTEVLDHNNEWQSTQFYQQLDISELWFFTDLDYKMKINNSMNSYTDYNTVTGTYKIEYGTVNMTDMRYLGVAYTLKIIRLDDTTLEGDFGIWSGLTPVYQDVPATNEPLQVRKFTVRLKRIRS